MISLQQVFARNNNYQLEEIDDELLLYNPAHTRTIYLNPSAAAIWKLCDGHTTAQAIITALQDVYPDAGNIAADIADALNQLHEFGAITVSDGE